MLAVYFTKAVLIGLAASIPLGPVGILCIQKTLDKGRWSGFSIGVGSSVTDTFYASIALLSVTFISDFLDRNRNWVMLIGVLIIFFIGLQIAAKNPVKDLRQSHSAPTGSRHAKEVLSGFLMTISNPGALVLMLGLFAFFQLEISDQPTVVAVLLVLTGVALGTLLWWFLLSSGVSLFRKKIRLRQLLYVNRISGIVIAILGLAALAEGLALLVFHQSLV